MTKSWAKSKCYYIGLLTLMFFSWTNVYAGSHLADKESETKAEHLSVDVADNDTRRVKGHVIDENGIPVAGATVVIKGTIKGVVTDSEGHFEITVPEEAILRISFLGMVSQDIKVPETGNVNITLLEESRKLNEVVVTGIFNRDIKNMPGAVSVVTDKELRMLGNRSVMETLSNVDPSVNIVFNNSAGMNPTRKPEIQLRGASSLPDPNNLESEARATMNTPLMVLDGFETTLQQVLDLDVEEIASITILKDASATAIYGSRGSNGVFVITTKTPASGQLKVSYSGALNIEVPDLSDYHLLNAADKLELERLSGYYDSSNPSYHVDYQTDYNNRYQAVLKGVDTYWLAKPLRVGIGHRNNVKVEGGDNTFRYSTALQYNSVKGVMKGSYKDTFNGTINLAYSKNNITFRNYLNIGTNKSSESPYGSFSEYARLNPYWAYKDADGKVLQVLDESFFGEKVINPMYNAGLNVINTSEDLNITDNFNIKWVPLDRLILEGKFGISHTDNSTDNFKPPTHTDFIDYAAEDVLRKGKYIYTTGKSTSYTFSASANYTRSWQNKHMLTAGLFFDLAQGDSEYNRFVVEGFPHETLKSLAAGLQYEKGGKPSGNESLSRRVGTVGNANYSFANRYVLDASLRIDGDSKYGKEKRYATFWSLGASWNLHEEQFMKDVSVFDRLRLRGSVGTTGANNFSAYEAMAYYAYYTSDVYKEWLGSYQMTLSNPKLTWQKTNKYNIGFEATVLKERLTFSSDFYIENTNGLVSRINLPPSSGFSFYKANIGEIQNKGVELHANVYVLKDIQKKLSWTLTAGLVHNQNKLVKLSDDVKKIMEERVAASGQNSIDVIYQEGRPQSGIYAVKSLGIDPANGKEIFVKKNGEVTYTWDPNDRVYCGNSQPKYRGNLNSFVQYKEWELSLAFSYLWGGQVYNSTLESRVENADNHYNVDRRVFEDRWQSPGDHAGFKGLRETTKTRYSSRFVQDESTIECKNIQLSYRFKKIDMLSISSMLVSVNMSDPFRFSTIKQERGLGYPFSRQFSLITRITF